LYASFSGVYGSIFLNKLVNELNIHEKLILKAFPIFPYLFESTIAPITAANTGSLIEVSASSSCDAGIHIKVGSLRVFFATATNHLILDPPPTHIAPSGSIPSFQILLRCSRTN